MRVGPPPSQPRTGHYLFAHRAVPRAFLRDPAPIMGILGSDDAMTFLGGMWDIIDRELEDEAPVDRRGLHLEHYELPGDVFIALLTMPAPQRAMEAYFVALAARLEGDTFARAFTLDLAGPPGPGAFVGILEWDAEGNRRLHDASCTADAAAFVGAIEGLLAEAP